MVLSDRDKIYADKVEKLCNKKDFMKAAKMALKIKKTSYRENKIFQINTTCSAYVKKLIECKDYDKAESVALENLKNKFVASLLVGLYINLNRLNEAKEICVNNLDNLVFLTQMGKIQSIYYRKAKELFDAGNFNECRKICNDNMPDEGLLYLTVLMDIKENNFSMAKEICQAFQKSVNYERLLRDIYYKNSLDIKQSIKNGEIDKAISICKSNLENEVIKSQYVKLLIEVDKLTEAILVCKEEPESKVFKMQAFQIETIIKQKILDYVTNKNYVEALTIISEFKDYFNLNKELEELLVLNGNSKVFGEAEGLLYEIKYQVKGVSDFLTEILEKEKLEQLIYKSSLYDGFGLENSVLVREISFNLIGEEDNDILIDLYNHSISEKRKKINIDFYSDLLNRLKEFDAINKDDEMQFQRQKSMINN